MTLKISKALIDNRLIGALDTFRVYSGERGAPASADDPTTGRMLVEFLGCHLEWNSFTSSFEKRSNAPWRSVAIADGQALYFRFSSAAKPEISIQGTVDMGAWGDLFMNNTDLRAGMPQCIDRVFIKQVIE